MIIIILIKYQLKTIKLLRIINMKTKIYVKIYFNINYDMVYT